MYVVLVKPTLSNLLWMNATVVLLVICTTDFFAHHSTTSCGCLGKVGNGKWKWKIETEMDAENGNGHGNKPINYVCARTQKSHEVTTVVRPY